MYVLRQSGVRTTYLPAYVLPLLLVLLASWLAVGGSWNKKKRKNPRVIAASVRDPPKSQGGNYQKKVPSGALLLLPFSIAFGNIRFRVYIQCTTYSSSSIANAADFTVEFFLFPLFCVRSQAGGRGRKYLQAKILSLLLSFQIAPPPPVAA